MKLNNSSKKFKNRKRFKRQIKENNSIINLYEYKNGKILVKYIKHFIYYILATLIIFILLFIIILYRFVGFKKPKEENINKPFEYVIEYNEKNISKFKNFLPKISVENNSIPSLKEIFNSRELYINNTKLSGEYIRFLRPINETEEEKYKNRYYEIDTPINIDEFKNRKENSYIEFAKLCLEEKLIDNNSFDYDNKPLISVVITSYNKGEFLIKSIRSIQNQDFKNIEIIIVNDCSTDNSNEIITNLLKTDPRIRVIHHLTNMGCWRTRMDGILYSRAKYIILFDVGDLYSDNYILSDTYKIIDKYNLDSVKFFFRRIYSYNSLWKSDILSRKLVDSKIIYEPKNIEEINNKIYRIWGNIWIRLARANIFIKGLLLLNDNILNLYKNVWDDKWFNIIINKVSYSFYIFNRIGYIYLQNGLGEGSPRAHTATQKDHKMREWISFLYFDYNFLPKDSDKKIIINKLKYYNTENNDIQLKFIISKFYVLNDLLELLIKDPYIKNEDKKFLEDLLNESKEREKNLIQKN